MSGPGSASAAARKALDAVSVHVKITPAPRNMQESREVLRVLQRFGEVVMFKSLKVRLLFSGPVYTHVLSSLYTLVSLTLIAIQYHPTVPTPTAALAIFKSASATSFLLS